MSTTERMPGCRNLLLRVGMGGLAALMVGTVGALPAISALSAQAASATAAPSSSPQANPLTLPRSSRPAPYPSTVSTTVTPGGVRVQVQHAPVGITGYDFTRTVGTAITDLTPTASPVGNYLDTSAAPGSSDTYTVKVASVEPTPQNKKALPKGQLTASVGEILGSATATVPATPTPPHGQGAKTLHPAVSHSTVTPPAVSHPRAQTKPPSAPAPKGPAQKPTSPPSEPQTHGASVKPQQLKADLVPATCQLSGTVLTVTLSPAKCPTGYEVTADVLIPKGTTVTVDAGTTIYVAATTDGGPTAGTDPTGMIDILVRGGFLVEGSASQPVTVTSVDAFPGAAGTPSPGDWGDLYYDGSGSSTAAGGLTHARVSYGTAVVADVATPVVSDTTISDMAGDGNGAGLDYEDMASGASISITGLTYDGTYGSTGVFAQSDTDTNFTTHHHSAAPFSISVTNSKITGGDTLWLESIGNGVTTGVAATITGDTLTGTSATKTELFDQASNTSSTTPGGATVTGTIANDTITGNESTNTAVYLFAESKDSTAPSGSPDSPATCASGAWAACDDVSFAADNISSHGTAVYSEAEVTHGPGSALVNNDFGTSTVPGGTIASVTDDAYKSYAYAYGTAGTATDTPTFFGTTVNSNDYGAYTEAQADHGTATATPVLQGSSFTASPTGNDDNLYVYVRGSDSTAATTGDAFGSPVIDDSTLTAKSDNVYDDVYSNWGSATDNPSVVGSTLTSSDATNIYQDEVYSAESGGAGTANANPTVTGSTLNAATDNLYVDDVYAYEGAVHSNVTVNGSSALDTAGTYNIYQKDIEGSVDATSAAGLSTANILIDGATLKANSYNIYRTNLYADYGPATDNVTILTSVLLASGDDNLYQDDIYGTDKGPGLNADVTTTVDETVANSELTAYDYNLYQDYVDSNYGPVQADSSVSGSTLDAQSDYNLYQYEVYGTDEGGTGSTSTNVSASGSTLDSSSGATYQDTIYSYRGTLSADVGLSGDTVNANAGYGIYQESLYGSDKTAVHGISSLVRTITNSSLKVYDEADYEDSIYSKYGTLDMPLTVTASSISGGSSSYGSYLDDIYGSETAGADSGQSTCQVTFTGSSVATYDEAIYETTVESDYGTLDANLTVTNTPLSSTDSYGVYMDDIYGSEDEGAPGTRSTADISLSGSAIQAYDEAIYQSGVDSEYGLLSANITATNSPISSTDSDAIYTDDNYGSESESSPGTRSTMNVSLVGSPLHAYSYGIYRDDLYSDYGTLSANVSATHSPIFAGDEYGIYQDTIEGSTDDGSPHTRTTVNDTLIDSPVTAEAYDVYYSTVESDYGTISADVKAVGSSMYTADDDAIYEDSIYGSYDEGSPGTQSTCNITLTHSPITSYEYAVYQDNTSYYGTLSANVTAVASPMVATDDYGIYQDNTGSDESSAGSGTSTANDTITTSDITSEDTPLYTELTSDYGSAEVNPNVVGSKLTATYDTSDSYGIYDEAYAEEAGGTATADPTLTNSQVTSYDTALYNEADSYYAKATADPTVTGSSLVSSDSDGLDNEAYGSGSGGEGSAAANPVVSGSSIKAESTAFYNEATTEHGNSSADASFTLTATPVTSTQSDGLDVEAYSAGSGSTTVDPKVTGSSIDAPDDYGVYLQTEPDYNTAKGSSTIGGSFTDSPVTSYDDAFDITVLGSGVGPATFDTTFSGDVIHSNTETGIDVADHNTSKNNGGSIVLDPTVTGGSITTPEDYAIYAEANGYGTTGGTYAVKVSPTISSVPMTSYDGVYLDATDQSTTTWSGNVTVGGSITGSSIVSQDTKGIDAEAYCDYCSQGSVEDLQVSNTPVTAYTEAGDFEATTSTGTTAPAKLTTSVTSTDQALWQSYDTTTIYGEADATGGGNVTNSLDVSDMHLSGYDTSIDNYADAASGNATNSSDFTGNVIDNTYKGSGQDGIFDETSATAGTAARTGQISGNQISGMLGKGDGIKVETKGAVEHPDLTISQNEVSNVGGRGIDVTTEGDSPAGQVLGTPPIYDVALTNNTVSRTGSTGIDTNGVLADVEQNNVSSDALGGKAAGIAVTTETSAGKVSCNAVWGNPTGVAYSDNSSGLDPVTNENSFTQPTSSVTNSPRNLMTNNAGTTSATGNWWGTTTATAIAVTIDETGTGHVLSATPLAAPPSCIPAPIPAPPSNAVSSESASSTCPSGVATVVNDGTTVTTGAGCGSLTLAQYGSDPVGATSNFTSKDRFFDLALGAGSNFPNLSIVDCNLNGGTDLWWWNASANAWQSVTSSFAGGPPACASAQLNGSTSPSLAQLTGTVFAVGKAAPTPPPSPPPVTRAVGYWMVAKDGGIFSFGNAAYYGSMGGKPLNSPMVGMASTLDHAGYWTVASDGGIFSFGDAAFYGSMGGTPLNKPIVGITSTPSGKGYWLVASDGGIFSFGDAAFYGSTGSMTLNQPVVGMVASPSGHGYLLVAADGGLFAFGDAHFYGSVPGAGVSVANVVGIAPTLDGRGYWIDGNDGGIYAFGDAAFLGSVPVAGAHVSNIVSMAATPDGGGYWVFGNDGGLFNFGDAPFDGSLPTLGVSVNDVVGAAAT